VPMIRVRFQAVTGVADRGPSLAAEGCEGRAAAYLGAGVHGVPALAAAGCGQALEAGTLIPVTRIGVPLLMGDGGQDPVWSSAASVSTIVSELDRSCR